VKSITKSCTELWITAVEKGYERSHGGKLCLPALFIASRQQRFGCVWGAP
jgi:hypothetical protein